MCHAGEDGFSLGHLSCWLSIPVTAAAAEPRGRAAADEQRSRLHPRHLHSASDETHYFSCVATLRSFIFGSTKEPDSVQYLLWYNCEIYEWKTQKNIGKYYSKN